MQRLVKSLTGSSLSNTSIQQSMTQAKDDLQKTSNHLQSTRQQPQIQTFETTAKYAQQVAEETTKLATTVQQYGRQQAQAFNFSLPEAMTTQLQDIITTAQTSSTRIAEGIQGARAHAYPEAIVFYVDQIAGTLEGIATLQGQLAQLAGDILTLADKADGGRQALQAQQQALQAQQQAEKQAIQAQQEAAKQAERDCKAYLAQYGGIDPVEIIAQVQAGTYPVVAAGIITQKGETVLFNTTASLSEDRTTTKHVGASSGYSVPLGHGFRFRVGSYQGQTIHSEHLTQIDQGNLIVTTKRLVFTGRKSTITIPVAKVLHTVLYKNGVDIRAENRQKREVFLCSQPLVTNTFILIACHLLSA